jgi:hypothetical protein
MLPLRVSAATPWAAIPTIYRLKTRESEKRGRLPESHGMRAG